MSDALALLSADAVRARCGAILAATREGCSPWFRIREAGLDDAAERVAALTRRRFPRGGVPPHSRWRHFDAGGIERVAAIAAKRPHRRHDPFEGARMRIDLAVVSVLLDAGAGGAWRFRDPAGGPPLGRSEGLAVASLRAFESGLFSSDPAYPLRVDAAGLARLDAGRLAQAFQVGAGNPLVGLDGRLALLHRLAEAMASQPRWFTPAARPGGLFEALALERGVRRRAVEAHEILRALLLSLGPIWPNGVTLDGVAVGDTWRHPHAGGAGVTAGWVPFHKLSQWLAYSLIEPFTAASVGVLGTERLTGLAEYRNGGLLLDAGAIEPCQPELLRQPLAPGHEAVVEWRALTVALLDELAPRVRARLGASAAELPLASVLEGGTWLAGRELAGERRGGEPPLRVDSDGTVF